MPQTNLGMMFKLFSISFMPPTRELARLVTSGELQNNAETIWKSLALPSAAIEAYGVEMNTYIGRNEDDVLHELRREHTRLFLGDKTLIANSEGMWRMKEEGRIAFRMINTYSREVADFMRECGVVRTKKYNDCIDYIENECDFASFLASSPTYLIDLGKNPLNLLDTFIQQHFRLWIPGFCKQVCGLSDVLYFTSLSGLMSAFVKEL